MSATSNASSFHPPTHARSAPSPTQSPLLHQTNTETITLDSDYTGHLLVDPSAAAPSVHTPDLAQDIKPFVFDATTVTETRPWWNEVFAADPNASVGVQTAEEMFKAYVDPYADQRRRMPYPPPPPALTNTANSTVLAAAAGAVPSSTSAQAKSSSSTMMMMVTPPGQLYQRFDYEDALLRIPDMPTSAGIAVTSASSAPPSATVLPPFSTLEAHIKRADNDDDDEEDETPVELIEAAVAALMANPGSAHHHHHHHQQQQQEAMWSTPASATFPSSYHAHAEPAGYTGPIRSRAHTVGHWFSAASPMMGGATQDVVMTSPDAYAFHHHHHDDDDDGGIAQADIGNGQHQCLWLGCNQILPSPAALTHHVNRYHIARRQPAHRCLWQSCPRASHVFRHRDKILIHVRLHTNDRPWGCDAPGCDKTFSRADSLEAHKKVHAAEGKSWQCRAPGCGRMYFHAKSLKKHERSAHGLELDV